MKYGSARTRAALTLTQSTMDARPGSLQRLRSALEGPGLCMGGVLSGTSADGIDVGLVHLQGATPAALSAQLLAFETIAFEEDLGSRVRAVLQGSAVTLREVALLDRDLGAAFGRASRSVAERAGLTVDCIASHGQTVYHHDGIEASGPATLQLGSLAHLSEAAGCSVVGDFRQGDVAAGGEGAPLSAFADPILFAHLERPVALLNLGGLSNLTLIGPAGELLAFDVGPAGALLDGLARRLLKQPMDRDGAAAAKGRAREAWVQVFLDHPFFSAEPPKSTGRDTFGEAWLDACLARIQPRDESGADLLASAVQALGLSVIHALQRFSPWPGACLVVAGGGSLHPGVMGELRALGDGEVLTSDAVGVPVEAREALVFAVLGGLAVLEEALPLPPITGARGPRRLGLWHLV